MRVYTEEEVIKLLNSIITKFGPLDVSYIATGLKHIELPTDEEIEESSPFRLGSGNYNASFSHRWQQGAKWMRDKIQGGNK
jgi:hypothetical protein